MAARSCFLTAFARSDCAGRLQRAHLVKQQTLRKEVWNRRNELEGVPSTMRVLMADPRFWVWACVRHHGMLDHARTLRIPRWRLPRELEAGAQQYGLEWWLDREYGALDEGPRYPSTAETCLSPRALDPGAYGDP